MYIRYSGIGITSHTVCSIFREMSLNTSLTGRVVPGRGLLPRVVPEFTKIPSENQHRKSEPKGRPMEGRGHHNRPKNDKNGALEPTSGIVTEKACKWRARPQRKKIRARGAMFFTIATDCRNDHPKSQKSLHLHQATQSFRE